MKCPRKTMALAALCLLLVLLAGCRVDQRQRDGKTGASPVRIMAQRAGLTSFLWFPKR